MSIASRIIAGALGLIILVGTVVFVLSLVALELDAAVLLAGYMSIGGFLFSAFLLVYAFNRGWQRNRPERDE